MFSLEELITEENSPFIRSRSKLTRGIDENSELNFDEFVYETKLCGTVFKSVLRDSYYKIRKRVKREALEEWSAEATEMVDKMAAVARHFHESAEIAKEFSEKVRYHTQLIDEYISYELERYLI